jgi:hypothetical protein
VAAEPVGHGEQGRAEEHGVLVVGADPTDV